MGGGVKSPPKDPRLRESVQNGSLFKETSNMFFQPKKWGDGAKKMLAPGPVFFEWQRATQSLHETKPSVCAKKKKKSSPRFLASEQGERIGRIFADWANVRRLGEFSQIGRIFADWANFRRLGDCYIGRFLENYKSCPNFGLRFTKVLALY
jgi:hypothetical protein